MKSRLKQNQGISPKKLRFFFIVLLVLGIFFRFINLERKVYWFDETFTSLRISGYTESELVSQVCDRSEIGIEDLQKYQRLAPSRTLGDTVRSLIKEDTQHPPLYYLIARSWVQMLGYSVATIRSLSVLISLLALPCIYWLCLELFGTTLSGWVGIVLIAVSPFHMLYAQEAREYSLWTVTILLSSAALLRAMRVKTKLSWGIYAATIPLGLYTFLLSGLVAIGHGIYVLVTESFRLSKTVTAYLLASLAGFLAFLPWLAVLAINRQQFHNTTEWTNKNIGLAALVKSWVGDLSRIFLDTGFDSQDERASIYLFIPIILITLILVAYAIYFLCRSAPQRIWLFILTLTGVTALALIIPDAILGGQRSTANRYLIPSYLGVQLGVTYLLSAKISSTSTKKRQQQFWQLTTVVLLLGGVLSCAISSQLDTSWHKDRNYYTPQVVSIINQTAQPLVITSCQELWPLADEMPLSYLLNPQVRLQVLRDPNMPQISQRFSDVFLLNPSETLLKGVQKERKYSIEPIYPEQLLLWKLVKQ